MLHTMEASFGDLESRHVADLGCGCGVLSLGAVMLGAGFVTGFDIDPSALDTFSQNISGGSGLESPTATFTNCIVILGAII